MTGLEQETRGQLYILVALVAACGISAAIWLITKAWWPSNVAALTSGMALGTAFVYVVSGVFGMVRKWFWISVLILIGAGYTCVMLVSDYSIQEVPGTVIYGCFVGMMMSSIRLVMYTGGERV